MENWTWLLACIGIAVETRAKERWEMHLPERSVDFRKSTLPRTFQQEIVDQITRLRSSLAKKDGPIVRCGTQPSPFVKQNSPETTSSPAPWRFAPQTPQGLPVISRCRHSFLTVAYRSSREPLFRFFPPLYFPFFLPCFWK